MDIISHGLWGSIAFGRKRKKNFWWAFGFGIMPDLFSFGIFTVFTALGIMSGPDWSNGIPSSDSIPLFVGTLYNITHSLIIFAAVFAIVWLIRKKSFLPMWAWGLHILMDIPTHSTDFFPTPFLWPFSGYRVDGISWGHPYIFFPNVVVLIVLYILFFLKKKKRKSNY